MVDEHPMYGPSSPIMTFSEKLISSPSAVSRSLPRIISYLPSVYSLTWYFHITVLFALNSGKKKSIFDFFEVVSFPDCVYHIFFLFIFIYYLTSAYPSRLLNFFCCPIGFKNSRFFPSTTGVHISL